MTRQIWAALPIAIAAVASCGSDRQVTSTPESTTIAPAAEATARASDLRRRFALPAREEARFEASADGVRSLLAAREEVRAPADVVLAANAGGRTRIEDRHSKMGVSFALKGATDAPLAVGDGLAIYAGGYPAADVLHRVHAEGTEDYVAFTSRPPQETLTYDVDVSQVAGLRLVDGTSTLELLDESGTPRLRVARPFVVDANGEHHDATLTLAGCAYDTSPVAPWGRPVTLPGARSCEVRVAWTGIAYPALVDPSWQTTGSASKSRQDHTSTLLNSGLVLVAGGTDTSSTWDVAELYNDAGGGTFAVTNPMKSQRRNHTATLLSNGNVLMVGGNGGLLGSTPLGVLSSAEIYSPGTGLFALTGSMTTPRELHTATRLANGNVLVAGGRVDGSNATGTAEIFTGSSFSGTGSMAARTSHTATLLPNGNVLVTGGSVNATILSSAQLFTGAAFTTTGTMTVAHGEHTATLLPSGSVLVVGSNGTEGSKVAELYANGAFTATGIPKEGHGRHTATLLDSGKVLISHGIYANNFVELYDPATASWAYTASVKLQRQWPAATKLQNGNVLVTGGPSASAERYLVTAAGSACTIADDCRSGVCEDAICCAAACSGTCKTCATGTGACTTVVDAQDPNSCTGVNICSGQGTCKVKTGEVCTLLSQCLSGFCADGYCCNKACNGGCDVCNVTPGTCTLLANGAAGANPSCGGFVCDGVNGGCPGNCTSDASCDASQYCSSNGTCQPKKRQAAACNLATDCKDGNCGVCQGSCVDGVCCDTACTGLCQACTKALKQNGEDGVCGPAKEGTNPHNDACPVDPQSTCKQDGKCSGSGGCRAFYPAGTSCGVSVCSATTNKASGFICNGAGTCANDTVGVSCFDYVCDTAKGSCPNTCTTDTQCSPGAYCNAGSCIPKGTNGTTCSEERQCATGLCVDGVCCNTTCTGQCEACDVAGAEGTCAPLTGTPHNERPKCAAGDPANPCAASTCDGDTRTACAGFVGPEVRCGAASCTNGQASTAGNCRKGACVTQPAVACGVYACGDTACKTSCEKKEDCTAGNLCDPTTKRCVAQATCDGDHTTTGANGQKQDCTPYKCQGDGTCKQACTSIDDCVAPTACDPSGKCVLPPPVESGDSGGCSMTPTRSSSALPLLTLVGLAAIARRRRAHRAGSRISSSSASG